MINHINIQNYKSILNMNLSLKTFNVMIGANGCGKSNILEAIAMASAAEQDKLNYEYFGSRGLRMSNPQTTLPLFEDCEAENILISVCPDGRVYNDYLIGYNSQGWFHKFTEAQQLRIKHWRENKKLGFENLSDYVIEKLTRVAEVGTTPDLKSLPNFLIYSLNEQSLRSVDVDKRTFVLGIHGEWLLLYLSELLSKENGIEIINEIKENLTVLDWFDDMIIPKEHLFNNFDIQLKDIYLKESANTFTQRSANEGFLYLLFYLTLIISDETPKFFAIENIETGFNPKLCREVVRRMVKLAKKHGKQIIVTTHNPSILDGLDLEDNEQNLLSVYRDIDGITCINEIRPKEPLSIPMSQAWVKGLIGGLPNNF